MTRVLIFTILTVFLATSPTSAACIMSYCKQGATPSRTYITNTDRQKVGDIYNPGHGRRIQIRDNRRQIIGYIERDGKITNPSRQPAASIEALRD